MLINLLSQTKMIGDKKMQLSQQMLDATERQSKNLKINYQRYSKLISFYFIFKHFIILVESMNQQNSLSDNNSNIDSETEYDIESGTFIFNLYKTAFEN